MRVASIEPWPEGADKTPVSSVSTPNLTTPPEISALARAATAQVVAALPSSVMNSRRLIASAKGSQDIKTWITPVPGIQ
jgi:hypothetical protein